MSEHPPQSFDQHADDAILLTQEPSEKQRFDDAETFRSAAEASRRAVEDDGPENVAVGSNSELRKKVVKGAAIAAGSAIAFGGAMLVTDKVLDVAEERVAYNQEQNRQWAEEQQEAERKMIQDGQITIDVPSEENR